jgi:hypothetical protein
MMVSCRWVIGIKTEWDFFNTVRLHIGNRPGKLTDDVERHTLGVLKGSGYLEWLNPMGAATNTLSCPQ